MSDVFVRLVLIWGLVVAASFGTALLVYAVAPGRHASAVEILGRRPLLCGLLGFVPCAAPIVGFFLVAAHRVPGGFVASLTLTALALGTGVGVAAVRLADRVLPEAPVPLLLAWGGAALFGLGALPGVGLLVLVLVGSCGLGAWLQAVFWRSC